jgi:hypothetical protein
MRTRAFTYQNMHHFPSENMQPLIEHIEDLQYELKYLEAMAYLQSIAKHFKLTRPDYLMGHYPDRIFYPLNISDMKLQYHYNGFNAIAWLDNGLDQLEYSTEYTKEFDWDGTLPEWGPKAYIAAAVAQRHWIKFHNEF